MDPRSKLSKTELSPEFLFSVIDSWLGRNTQFHWKTDIPEIVIRIYETHKKNGKITYLEAVNILRDYSTSKLSYSANRGMRWVEEHWKAEAKKTWSTIE